jgi:hypothetical protein
MIRSFRERPLALFGVSAAIAVALSLAFAAAAVVAMKSFGPDKANALVFPGVALVWLELACYLVMLGLIAEVALSHERRDHEDQLPIAHREGEGE